METTKTLQKDLKKAQKWPVRSRTAAERFLQKYKTGLIIEWASNQIEMVTEMQDARNSSKT
ncbi:MAG: hypothetical protein P1P88_05140 [Bacteroidales bacterium]|nr:hypothetical protein [Bacteroidales bacterium]